MIVLCKLCLIYTPSYNAVTAKMANVQAHSMMLELIDGLFPVSVDLKYKSGLSVLIQVRNIIEDPPCRCPTRFFVEKQSKGRYRLGEKVLYVRVGTVQYVSTHSLHCH